MLGFVGEFCAFRVEQQRLPSGDRYKVLEHKLKEIEEKLIRNKKLEDEHYKTPIPHLNVYAKKLRELSVPDEDKAKLSLANIQDKLQLLFHIECSEVGWR